MPPLRELRYDGVTLSPRPRSFPLHRGAGPFNLSDIFPPVRLAAFLPSRKKRNPRRDAGLDVAAARGVVYAGSHYPDEPTSGCCSGEESDDGEDLDLDGDGDESEAKQRPCYVVGPDSIRFVPPVDRGSLTVADRRREVHVPSPCPRSNWSRNPEPWQRFYLDLGAGRRARSEEELNQELWIAFLLDRGAGRYSAWWEDLKLAFDSISSAELDLEDPQSAAKRRCLRPAVESEASGPGTAPRVRPLARTGVQEQPTKRIVFLEGTKSIVEEMWMWSERESKKPHRPTSAREKSKI